jgi:DNA-binding beta-propeller fold protein YncE
LSAYGRYLIASCEFSGTLLKVDVSGQKLLGTLELARHSMPQDVKLSPDGAVFYVADIMADGVYLIDGENLDKIGFIPTGKGAHGLYVSRDSRVLYVSNREEGSVSLIDLANRRVIRKWQLPGRASPDMAASQLTARCCGCRAATIPRFTPSTPAMASCRLACR